MRAGRGRGRAAPRGGLGRAGVRLAAASLGRAARRRPGRGSRVEATGRGARDLAAAALVLLAGVAGCAGPDGHDAGATDAALAGAAVAHPLPEGAPDRFGFGTPADPARVAAWDVDVKPDGEGLPPGAGTVAEGARVWADRCAACHGATGVEGPQGALVGGAWPEGGFPEGRTVGSYWPWATTLYDYIRRAMPQDRPGTLAADETYAVIAWILNRNGIVDDDAVMDAEALPAVVMPARGRFVPDDRTDGPVVR